MYVGQHVYNNIALHRHVCVVFFPIAVLQLPHWLNHKCLTFVSVSWAKIRND